MGHNTVLKPEMPDAKGCVLPRPRPRHDLLCNFPSEGFCSLSCLSHLKIKRLDLTSQGPSTSIF